MKSIILTLSLFCSFLAVQAKNWAVLVGSSNGFSNYGDQGTVFYAYHNLIKNGIAPENIILFAYDDIANSRYNPFPGKVFTAPTDKGGKEVYEGVKIDYKEKDISGKTFLDVIQGNSSAVGGRRVLNSTAEDNVFIYINDHGAEGLVYFVHGYLYADDLNKALKNMHEKKMYKQLVFYLDACESGSMFENLLDPNINVYATTSANSHEYAYMNFCPPEDVVDGKHIGACISAEYSWSFLSHIESADLSKETLAQQFEMIKKDVVSSHAQKFGSEDIAKETADNFQAQKKSAIPTWINFLRPTTVTPIGGNFDIAQLGSKVNTRDKKLAFLINQQKMNPSQENTIRMLEEMESQKRLNIVFGKLGQELSLTLDQSDNKIDFDCLKARVSFYERRCGKLSEYGLQYIRHLNQVCRQNVKDDVFEFIVEDICSKHPFIETHDD